MSQSYFALLRKSPSWTLLFPTSPRLEEIMNDYRRTYNPTSMEDNNADDTDPQGTRGFSEASPLDIEQFRIASGPFLRLDSLEYVKLQDPDLYESSVSVLGNQMNRILIRQKALAYGEEPEALDMLLRWAGIEAEKCINLPDDHGYTPLHTLVAFRRQTSASLLKAFVDNGANVNIEDKRSPKVEDIDDPDDDGDTALHEAAHRSI
ncbi:hypothetical protein F4680DRAFT_445978 [Xylaria scruposa]|nr:hypothetical protein F4680DRAFT_445978 [Xylaria scruposa]